MNDNKQVSLYDFKGHRVRVEEIADTRHDWTNLNAHALKAALNSWGQIQT